MKRLNNLFHNNTDKTDTKSPANIRDTLNKKESYIEQMFSFKSSKEMVKKSSDNILDQKMHPINSKRYGGDSQKREENKGSSVTRKNLFKKKSSEVHEETDKSQMKSRLKNVGYKSLLEKRESSRDLYKRYQNKTHNLDQVNILIKQI